MTTPLDDEPVPTARSEGCPEIDIFIGLVTGQLKSTERIPVEAHIDGCADCRVLLDEAALALEATLLADRSMQPMVFGPGSEVANRYRIERFMARGGMGEIYRAHDLILDESIALKTITATAADSPKAIQRLKAEVKLSRRVAHPHVCRIYDFGEHDDGRGAIHYLTMEFVEGQSLGARMRARGRMPLADVLLLSEQLIGGIIAAHEAGVLHRDFKSDNIMLRDRSARGLAVDAVIMDFGLARALHQDGDRLTSNTQALLGSAAYMAPEQVEGAELSESADVYAFGVVLFELLTGTLPFRGGSPMATALLRLRRLPPKPSTVVTDLEPAWDELVLGCLHRDATKRLLPKQVLQRLNAIASGSPPARPRMGRRWAGAAGVAVVLLLAVTTFRSDTGSTVRQPTPEMRAPLSEPVTPAATQLPPAPSGMSRSAANVDSTSPMPNSDVAFDTKASSDSAQPPSILSLAGVATVNARRWAESGDRRSCREAQRLLRLLLGSLPAAHASRDTAARELTALGDCVAAEVTNGPQHAPKVEPLQHDARSETAASTNSTRTAASALLPSDDPLDGFLDVAPVRLEPPAKASANATRAP